MVRLLGSHKPTDHGKSCGRLLGPLIGYMKIEKGLVKGI